MIAPETVFWTSAALSLYLYAGYPAIAVLLARFRPRPYTRGAITPPVSVLIAAHDEEKAIGPRIANLLALDYPPDCMEILVGSDGSTDGTAARARLFEPRGVVVFDFPERRGKPAVLSDLARAARGEILVFCDARQRFLRLALRALVAPFKDPRVGAVGGDLLFRGASFGPAVSSGIGFFRRYESLIRAAESRFDSTIGVSGAIYAARRRLIEPIPDDTILDDVLIPLRIIRRGYRVVVESSARAIDRPPRRAREELTRKARTIAGTFQLFAREHWLLNPVRNRVFLQTVSHKGLRLLSPLLHAAALISCALAGARPFYRAALIAQLTIYAWAFAGAVGQRLGRKLPLANLPYTLLLLDAATLVAFWRFLRGSQEVRWTRVDTAAAGPRGHRA